MKNSAWIKKFLKFLRFEFLEWCDVGKYLCKDDFLLLALLFVDDCSSQTTWPIHNTRESWEILCICKTCLQHPGIRVMVPSPQYAAPRFVLPRNCCLFMKRRGKYGKYDDRNWELNFVSISTQSPSFASVYREQKYWVIWRIEFPLPKHHGTRLYGWTVGDIIMQAC